MSQWNLSLDFLSSSWTCFLCLFRHLGVVNLLGHISHSYLTYSCMDFFVKIQIIFLYKSFGTNFTFKLLIIIVNAFDMLLKILITNITFEAKITLEISQFFMYMFQVYLKRISIYKTLLAYVTLKISPFLMNCLQMHMKILLQLGFITRITLEFSIFFMHWFNMVSQMSRLCKRFVTGFCISNLWCYSEISNGSLILLASEISLKKCHIQIFLCSYEN